MLDRFLVAVMPGIGWTINLPGDLFAPVVPFALRAAGAIGPDVLEVMGTAAGAGELPLADGFKIVLLLTAIALLPAALVAMTSFTRTIIVLSMLRHAFGMPDTPPATVLVSVALFLTLLTMSPVATDIYSTAIVPLAEDRIGLERAVEEGVAPLRRFMTRQTREQDLALVLDAARVPIPESIDEVGTLYIVPAFLISELKTAFQIGFVIFLPFLLLDLVVASILMSMGMLMVPPTVISLPLKILMFVVIDGWGLVIRGLLGSFR
jgi:flagellar biosynthesis protein FliP